MTTNFNVGHHKVSATQTWQMSVLFKKDQTILIVHFINSFFPRVSMFSFAQTCNLAANPPRIRPGVGTTVSGTPMAGLPQACRLNRNLLAFDAAMAMGGERAEVAGNMMAIGNNIKSYYTCNSVMPAGFNSQSAVHAEILGASMIQPHMIKP